MKLPAFASLPFVIRLAIDPVRALDLLDAHATPDHTKIVPFIVIVATVMLQLLHAPFTVAQMLVIFPASFGAAMYHRFMRYKAVTATVTDSTTKSISQSTVTQILARRNAEDGIDPTHE